MGLTLEFIAQEVNNNFTREYNAVLEKDYLAVKYNGRTICKVSEDFEVSPVLKKHLDVAEWLEYLISR